ncbi:hypothetical protein [Bacillus thuringiensis]|uniref:Uncharacterized protein n=1 Tax=Bacillus thuringiensis TaxID=1428 RepID=A0A9X6WSK0_BACTU|nr:hypothetical protein [Bacillus thuringiensis]PFJ42794.1 hypothetical protein COJ15_05480 [Bacillus thuringiensis]
MNKLLYSTGLILSVGIGLLHAQTIKVHAESCVQDDVSYGYEPEYQYTPTQYSDPNIKLNITEPIYDKDLTASDVTATQDWEYTTAHDYYQYTSYKASKPDETCSMSTSESFVKTEVVGKKSGTKDVTVSISRSGSKANGTVVNTITASANGKTTTKTVNTYWVKDVKIDAGVKKDFEYASNFNPSITCKLTYGDGTVKDCSSGTIDSAGVSGLIDSKVATESPIMKAMVKNPSLLNFWSKDSNNGEVTPGLGYGNRIHPAYRKLSEDNANSNLIKNSSAIQNGAQKQVYRAGFGDLLMYAYKDKNTGKEDYAFLRTWHAATIDVEDETRNRKKEIYAQNHVWNDGKLFEKDAMTDVSCTVYFFGPIPTKQCEPRVEDDNSNVPKGKRHVLGGESIDNIFNGKSASKGDEYRFIKYVSEYDDGGTLLEDEDFRTVIFADGVYVNQGYMKRSASGSDNFDIKNNPEENITVLETNNKGVSISKNYATYEGYNWNAYTEEYDHFNIPTCTVKYASSLVNPGYVREKDCTNMQYNIFDDNAKSPTGGKSFTYKYGQPLREGAIGYIENGVSMKQTNKFHYATKVDINIANKYTYQDEKYPIITCTKVYDFGNLSCADKMYITQDTGQNDTMGGQRHLTLSYLNNGYSSQESMTRVYANKVDITAPAKSGKSGFRGKYYATVLWQDGVRKDISLIEKVWKSEVCSTGEEVKYLDDVWNYTDSKGDVHGNSSRNEFYIPDPVSKRYCISARYPVNVPFNNGLTDGDGWSYMEETLAQKRNDVTFDLIGIKSVQWQDNTVYVHDIDKDSSGSQLTNSFPVTTATDFKGVKNAPNYGGRTPLAFNDKTYQTGHWYDFRTRLEWDNGDVEYLEDTSSYPEATWRYKDKDGNYRFDYKDYPVDGTNGHFPYNSNDHRLLLEGWNALRFDLFNEPGIRQPAAQDNNIYQKTFSVAHAWAHSPNSIVIAGPSVVADPKSENEYKAYLNWIDGRGIKQNGNIVGSDNNPWGENHGKRTDVTNSLWTTWKKEEETLTTPTSGPVKISFPEFNGNNFYRTISVSWGDKHRTLPGFTYWDYFTSQLQVMFNNGNGGNGGNPSTDTCANIVVPTMNCPLPVDKTYRIPSNDAVSTLRTIEFGIKFRVTGVSQGSGE